MAARLAGYSGPRAVRMGCVVELLHTATLIHDDVVDQAPLRRGRPSANARWGDDASILVGDHLYSKSFALMVRDGDPAVLETLARATVSMTEAEVFQLERKRSGTTTEADYLRIITQKTASFISACCRIGALLGGVERRAARGPDALRARHRHRLPDQRRLARLRGRRGAVRQGHRRRPPGGQAHAAPHRRARARGARPSASASRRCSRRHALERRRDRGDPPARRQVRRGRLRARSARTRMRETAKEDLGRFPTSERPGDARPHRRLRRRPRPVAARRRPSPIVTLTTDFGLRDPWVGVMKGVILGICPDARLVDLTHEVPAPRRPRRRSSRWKRGPPFFPPGTVHLAVVDPGVGERAARHRGRGAAGTASSGPTTASSRSPSTGEWSAVAHRVAAASGCPRVSATFHGRDVFAPAAAHLACGRGAGGARARRCRIPCGRRCPARAATGAWRARRGPRRRPLRQSRHVDQRRGPGVARAGARRGEGGSDGRGRAGRGVFGGQHGGRARYSGSQGRLEIFVREGSALAAIGPAPRAPVRVRSLRRRPQAP